VEEHEKKADEYEKRADELEEQGDQVEEDISDARSDFESKLDDVQAPGLLDEEDAAPGGLGESEEDEHADDEDGD
jgi:hypothetical protein